MYSLEQSDILFEDNHVIVVLKPPGVPSQPDRSADPDMLGLVKRFLVIRDQKAGDAWLGLVHRLDRPTSGIMVYAKTSKAASRMSSYFRGREVKKYYVAKVRGIPDQSSGTLRDCLTARETAGRVRIISTDSGSDPMTMSGNERLSLPDGLLLKDGKPAELAWTAIGSSIRPAVDETLLFIELLTGRRHQIRVQLAGRGFPILGDRRYGNNDERDLSVPTLALHACGLVFPHPVQKTTLAFYQDPSINASFTQQDVELFNGFLASLLDSGQLSHPVNDR